MLLALQAGVLADLLKDYLFGATNGEDNSDAPEPAVLHVDWRVTSSSGDVRRIVADGNAEAVLEALDKFERDIRDD